MNSLVSIVIVNFKVADIIKDCIKSISEQNIDVEVIVVDNNSGDHDRDSLESLRRNFTFLKIMFNKENEGFSKANNQALAVSKGDFILFLNPDTFLFPSCLEHLISFLKRSCRIGGVIPKLWMDREKTFLMPPSYLPSLWGKIRVQLHMSRGWLFAAYQKMWLKKALSFWNSDVPLVVDAISGAFFMTERSVLDAVGSFDERFSLYFEDSDLCRRIKKAGLKLYYYPHAEAVHYYNQSAKNSPESMQKFITSEKLYMEKYYNPYMLRFVWQLDKFPKKEIRPPHRIWDFSKPIKTKANSYLLFSPLETMMPCVAHKVKDEQFTFDNEFAEKLAGGVYYVILLTSQGDIYERFVMEKL